MKQIFILWVLVSFIYGCEMENTVPSIPLDRNDVIFYSKNPDGYNALYKLEAGKETLLIGDPDYDYWWPKVSPDKTQLLVYRSSANPDKNHDDYENAELMLANIDGTELQTIIPKNKFNWNAQGVCRWNIDGTKILMAAELEENGLFQWRMVTTDVSGENPKILSDRWALDCNFSKDNNHIVFMGFKDNNLTFDLTKLELQMGTYLSEQDTLIDIVSVTSNETRDHDPDFSPDNKTIVFSAGNAIYNDVDLTLFDVDSKTETKLLDDDKANGGSMCWTSDGKHIYFHSLELFKSLLR